MILEAWKMKFGKDATVLRLVGGIQAMEMQVTVCDKEFRAIAFAAAAASCLLCRPGNQAKLLLTQVVPEIMSQAF